MSWQKERFSSQETCICGVPNLMRRSKYLKSRGEWGLVSTSPQCAPSWPVNAARGRLTDLQRRLPHRFSDGTQRESLCRYNNKYQSYWQTPYSVLSGFSNAAVQGLAIADVEGLAEVPLLGQHTPPVGTPSPDSGPP
ncbi:hypothetical protein [Dactylosporangium sp. NPDC048998]|uniref:hypothetical protein n=1 Tax=Dactylosporangium sp. NPDC048998 TaxID=3363976 RepID=UPI003713B363